MSDKRIFDDPNHPQYGPVRRCWVVMAQLDMLPAAERYRSRDGLRWDELIALRVNYGHHESFAQRELIHTLMEGWI